jgi:hypothetical protein
MGLIMNDDQTMLVEKIQRMIVALVATNPAGQGLSLIGGFRYRFLDGGTRRSMDVDYHWDGDLAEKQAQLVQLFRRRLIPDVRRRLQHDGGADPARGPDADSMFVKIIDLAFWRKDAGSGRIEIPVDITRIPCFDPPEMRTADGVVYRTASNTDMIEGKVISLFSQIVMAHRDIVDVFLFSNHLAADSAERIRKKTASLQVRTDEIQRRIADFETNRSYHIRAINDVVSSQMDAEAAMSVQTAGGGAAVLDASLNIFKDRLQLGRKEDP